MMCQTTDGANCEDGVAPEGALHLSEGEQGESLGQVGYEASVRSFDNSDVDFGTWDDLDPVVKALWEDIAAAILKAAGSQSPIEEATSVADTVPAASEQGESPDGDRAVVNEAAGASSPFGLPSLSQAEIEEDTLTREEQSMLANALLFYADPSTYHAIGFMFDHPCGEFASDFEKAHGSPDYGRPMPGRLARRALAAISSERDTRPKDGDPQGAPLASSPVPEGNSPDVPAANKSASLTPQNFEAKASFIVEMCPVLGVDEYYQLAITSALSQAYEDGKRRWRNDCGILLAQLDFLTEATGEGLDCRDAGLVHQIRADYQCEIARKDNG